MRLGPEVERGFLQVVSAGDFQIDPAVSGRRELAQWLTHPEHPLTARVMANRIWQHLFGRGIVRTSDNFGQMGARPTHPELLDHLAIRFMQSGWSTKSLIRSIVLSKTYQQSSEFLETNYAIDGNNDYLWRMTPSRLEIEVIRDAILTVSDQLELDQATGSGVPTVTGEVRSNLQLNKSNHRSVYLPIVRSKLPEFMTVFDFPDSSEVRGQRDVTTVPTQALFMMNSPFVLEQASLAADNLLSTEMGDKDRIVVAYRQTLGRTPTEAESDRMLEYVSTIKQELASGNQFSKQQRRQRNQRRNRNGVTKKRNAWTDVYHALFASAEFRYRS